MECYRWSPFVPLFLLDSGSMNIINRISECNEQGSMKVRAINGDPAGLTAYGHQENGNPSPRMNSSPGIVFDSKEPPGSVASLRSTIGVWKKCDLPKGPPTDL